MKTQLQLHLLLLTLLSLSGFAHGQETSPQAIPWSQLGAKAGADYQGDALAVIPTAEGARLRCAFQRLEGEATREGLWLTSTVTNAVNDRFRVVAADVRRLTSTRNLKPKTQNEVQSLLTSAATDQGSLPRTGNVSIDGQSVRFTRPGLVEEYTASMDGVRQDFVLLERPPGLGELVLRLAVSGARVESAAFGAQVVLANSGRKIAYSRLRVTDATGKELTARMEVASDRAAPATLAVVVNDAAAVYPVRIDPTFSDANWSSMGGMAGTDGFVLAAVADGSGNVYIGGGFTVAGEVIANNVAKWDGSSWSPLGSGIGNVGQSSEVHALAVSGSDLYVGGYFTTAGGSAATNIAKWNGGSWSALGSGMGGGLYWPIVSALAVSGSDLYVGGRFTRAGGSAAKSIAKWDGSSWSALGSGMDGGPYYAGVYALAVSGSDLYVGGNFTTAGGSAAKSIAKWDGSGWSALGSGIAGTDNRGQSYDVSALAVSGSDLY
ncbi:MAG: trimeric autotransporter adhesin, partial [Verrucomicrobiota bacterium]